MDSKELGEKRWILREEKELNIFRKIQEKSTFKLKIINILCYPFQYIIYNIARKNKKN